MNELGFALNIVGVVPLVAAGFIWFFRFSGGRSFLKMRPNEPVDVVLTTSGVTPSAHGAPVSRPLTGIGQVESIGSFARALGKHYGKKPVRINMSVRLHNRLDGDLLIVGGPSKNAISEEFLEHLIAAHPEINLKFDDVGRNLDFASMEPIRGYDVFARGMSEGEPRSDIGLVIAWRNPYSRDWRRGFLVAGFSSYGTAAAADYLFNDILNRRIGLRAGLRRLTRTAPPRCFVEVISARFSEGRAYGITRVSGGFAEIRPERRT